MESVGQKLRAIRLQQGLTLEDISAKTRISRKSLQSVESDDVTSMGAFFYKSFVRQFAQQLKLDYKELAAGVESLTSTLPDPFTGRQPEAGVPLPFVPSLRKERPKKLRWLYSFGSFIVMLIACSSLYSMWQNSRSTLQASVAQFVGSVMNGRGEPARAAGTAKPVAAPQAATAPIAAATVAEGAIRVELSAVERTWLSIVADGQETFRGVLETDQTKVLEGHETARVRTGNAGGLNVVFNGRAIGSLGPRGQVRTVVFTPTGYETFEPSATPAAHLSVMTPFIPNGE